jgi:hypothetical protein
MNIVCRTCNDNGDDDGCLSCGVASIKVRRRKDYPKQSIGEFVDEVTNYINIFANNMEVTGAKDTSFPDWYEMFGAWLEVGTDEEEETFS